MGGANLPLLLGGVMFSASGANIDNIDDNTKVGFFTTTTSSTGSFPSNASKLGVLFAYKRVARIVQKIYQFNME